jgi:hypothetical protein
LTACFSAGGGGGRKVQNIRRNPHTSFAAASELLNNRDL